MDAGSPKSGQEQGFIYVGSNRVYGKLIDEATRCEHYHSKLDILAIKFPCCNKYYPCFECHEACAGHRAHVWKKRQRKEKAILCGSCGHESTIETYLANPSHCSSCGSDFNPRCSLHHHLYFEL